MPAPPLEPIVALPASVRVQPTLQFAQSCLDRRIDFAKMPQAIALHSEFDERWLLENPVGLPMKISLEEEFPSKVTKPLVWQISAIPDVAGDGT
ncbi:MAG: hypothetical protein ABJF10_28450 [Chthoniobacter sp.]